MATSPSKLPRNLWGTGQKGIYQEVSTHQIFFLLIHQLQPRKVLLGMVMVSVLGWTKAFKENTK